MRLYGHSLVTFFIQMFFSALIVNYSCELITLYHVFKSQLGTKLQHKRIVSRWQRGILNNGMTFLPSFFLRVTYLLQNTYFHVFLVTSCECAQLGKSREEKKYWESIFELNSWNWILWIKFVMTYVSTFQADLKKFNTDLNRELKELQKLEKIRLRNPADRQSIVSFTYWYHCTFMRNTFYLLIKPLLTTNRSVSISSNCAV